MISILKNFCEINSFLPYDFSTAFFLYSYIPQSLLNVGVILTRITSHVLSLLNKTAIRLLGLLHI